MHWKLWETGGDWRGYFNQCWCHASVAWLRAVNSLWLTEGVQSICMAISVSSLVGNTSGEIACSLRFLWRNDFLVRGWPGAGIAAGLLQGQIDLWSVCWLLLPLEQKVLMFFHNWSDHTDVISTMTPPAVQVRNSPHHLGWQIHF